MYAHKQTFLTKIDVHTDVHVQMIIIRVSQILLNVSCEQISLGEITKECDWKKCNVLQIWPRTALFCCTEGTCKQEYQICKKEVK